MVKIHSNVAHNFNHNIVQQPKTVKETTTLKVQSQPNTRGNGNTNPPERATLKNSLGDNILKLKLEAKLNASIASKTKASAVKVTYVPADQRHEGLSRFDNKLDKHSKGSNGNRNGYRTINTKEGTIKPKKGTLLFPLKAGKHVLVDGNGVERGTIVGEVKLNFGGSRVINGEKHYYVLGESMKDKNSGKNIGASSWVSASAIEKGNDPGFTKDDIAKVTTHAVPTKYGEYKDYKQYVVKNVLPEDIKGSDGKPKYGYMKGKDYISYKVLPEIPLKGKGSIAASDYLMKKGNVINLGFNAAGVSNDTFKVNETDAAGNAKPIVFHRAPTSLKDTTVDIDLYYPKEDGIHAGKKPVGRMRFVYGYVVVEDKVFKNGKPEIKNGQQVISHTKEWGWMALGALKPKN